MGLRTRIVVGCSNYEKTNFTNDPVLLRKFVKFVVYPHRFPVLRWKVVKSEKCVAETNRLQYYQTMPLRLSSSFMKIMGSVLLIIFEVSE